MPLLILLIVSLAAAVAAGCGGGPDTGKAPDRAKASPTPAPRTDAAAIARRADVPVLCYHQIRRPTAADSAQDRAYIVSPRVFAQQMKALDRAGYTTVTGDELADHVLRGMPLPRKPVLLTFDDASDDHYDVALPILERHGFKATFFVMTVVLGKPGWLTRRQVRALDRAGMTIGAHTGDHQPVPEYGGEDWAKQLGEPKLELTKLVGHPIRLFAYPFGVWDRKAFANLERVGFEAAFQLADRIDRRAPQWTIRRIIVPEISGRELLREMRRQL
jgi:peptidoglycan/xylan/chitin deacetylase (PgdA/CDA1 family)